MNFIGSKSQLNSKKHFNKAREVGTIFFSFLFIKSFKLSIGTNSGFSYSLTLVKLFPFVFLDYDFCQIPRRRGNKCKFEIIVIEHF